LASENRVAGVVSARIVIDAGDVGVSATSCRIAGVVGANVVVIAVNSQVEGKVSAARQGIATVVSASVVIIAVNWSVFAGSSGWIAGIIAASVSVIASNGGGITVSCGGVASDNGARNRGADNVGAETAWLRSEGASRAGAATIEGARVIVGTDLGDALASCCSDAKVISAWIVVVADNWGESATGCWGATISCAQVTIIAWSGRECASVSSLSLSARVCGALVVVVTDVGADASCTAGAETKATRSTWIAWNINAGGNDETVQDTAELIEVWSGEVGLNAWNIRGDESDLIDVVSCHSDGKDDNAVCLCVVDHRGEGAGLNVVLTISEHDHDFSNIGSSSAGDEVLVGGVNTATNASVSSLLGSRGNDVEEGLLGHSQGNDHSGSSGEHNKTHGNVLRTKGVSSRDGGTKVLHVSEAWAIDRTRLIEDEHEVDHLVALLSRAVPCGVFSEGGSDGVGKGSH